MAKTCHCKNEFINHKGDQVKQWKVIKKLINGPWKTEECPITLQRDNKSLCQDSQEVVGRFKSVFHKYWVGTSEKFTKNKPPIY